MARNRSILIITLFSRLFLHDVRLDLLGQVPTRERNLNAIENVGSDDLTRNSLYVIISIPTSFAFFLISFSFSSVNFFVKTIRFNVETCPIILSTVRTFSGLSTKTVFNEAK